MHGTLSIYNIENNLNPYTSNNLCLNIYDFN